VAALQSRAVARILYLRRNALQDSIGQGQWSVRPKPVSIKVQSTFYFGAKAEVNPNFSVIIIIHTVMLLIYEV